MIKSLLAAWLVSLVPPVFMLAHNADSVAIVDLLWPLALLSVGTLGLLGVFRLLLGDHRRAAVGTAVFWVLFYSYGGVCDALWDGRDLASIPRLGNQVGLAFLLLLVFTLAILRWYGRSLTGLVNWLVVAAGFVLLLAMANYYHRPARPKVPEVPAAGAFPPGVESRRQPAGELPDIYHIILDGHAGRRSLAELYGFDNSAFHDELRQRGFAVFDPSFSNYSTTFLSLSSVLNYQYYDLGSRHRSSRMFFYRQIQNSRAARQLQSLGYSYLLVGSNWAGTERSELASRVYRFRPLPFDSEFASVLWRLTPLRRLEPSVAHSHLFAFDSLAAIAANPAPTYTFAHLLLPHNPYVFDEHGTIINHVPQTLHFDRGVFSADQRWGDRQGYVAQLRFTNGRILTTIDRILAQSKIRPIIILQADHGSATLYGQTRDIVALARERHDILNAVLAPGDLAEKWPPTATLINTYPTLFRVVFGLPFQPLEERIFYSWYRNPYDLHEVTAELLDGGIP